MPLVSIYTSNLVADPPAVLSEITTLAAAELGKPEAVVMVRLESDATLAFGGSSIEPSALFEVEGIELPAEAASPLTQKLCQYAEQYLGVPQSRVFVKLTCVPRGMWGGNGKVY